MPFVHRLAALAAAFAVVATPLAGWSQAAPTLDQFKAAQGEFVTRLTDAQAGKATYPRLSDPKTATMVRTALDSRVLSQVDFSDIAGSLQICTPGAMAPQTYLTAGIADPAGAMASPTPDQTLKINSNSVLYRDELTLSLSFMLDCFGRTMGPLTTFWAGMDEPTKAARRSGVTQIRDGTGQIYEGGVTMLSEAPYSLANKEQVLSALIRNAPAFAAVMTPTHRARVVGTIDTVSKAVPAEMRPRLAQMRATFSATACTGLCAV